MLFDKSILGCHGSGTISVPDPCELGTGPRTSESRENYHVWGPYAGLPLWSVTKGNTTMSSDETDVTIITKTRQWTPDEVTSATNSVHVNNYSYTSDSLSARTDNYWGPQNPNPNWFERNSSTKTYLLETTRASETIDTSGTNPKLVSQESFYSYVKTGDKIEEETAYRPATYAPGEIERGIFAEHNKDHWHYDKNTSETSSLSGNIVTTNYTSSDKGWWDWGYGPSLNSDPPAAPTSTKTINIHLSSSPGPLGIQQQSDIDWIVITNGKVLATIALVQLLRGNPSIVPPQDIAPPVATTPTPPPKPPANNSTPIKGSINPNGNIATGGIWDEIMHLLNVLVQRKMAA